MLADRLTEQDKKELDARLTALFSSLSEVSCLEGGSRHSRSDAGQPGNGGVLPYRLPGEDFDRWCHAACRLCDGWTAT